VAHVTELFLDDDCIEMSGGVTRRIQQPEKYPLNPVLKPEYWWEGKLLQSSCALYDKEEKLFKLWMRAGRGFGKNPFIDGHELYTTYGTSRDGIVWERPNLGLLELAGKKDHNVILTGGVYPKLPHQGKKGWIENVIKNPHPTCENNKYVCAYYDMKNRGFFLGFSSDGVRWEKENEPFWQTPLDLTNWGDDAISNMIYDKLKNKWVMYRRVIPQESERLVAHPEDRTWKMPDRIMRVIGYAESEDLKEWKNHQIILSPDADDDPDIEFYALSLYIYEGVYVGYLWIYHMVHHLSFVDMQLVTSRDGIHFTRCCRKETFLPAGPRGSFDYMACMSYQSEPIVVNNSIYFYYTASNFDHYKSYLRKDAVASIGLARSPRNRFVYLVTGHPEPCRLVTKPFVVKDPNLYINAATWPRGSIKTEVLSRDWKPLPGFEAHNSRAVRGNNLAHPVHWNRKDGLGSLIGQEIRLKFNMVNARLYAMTFADEEQKSVPLPKLQGSFSFIADYPVE
jgi:hypothetical protein